MLQALGKEVTQANFFNSDPDGLRSRFKVTFGGMSLGELAALLRTHGMRTSTHYADEFSIEQFRSHRGRSCRCRRLPDRELWAGDAGSGRDGSHFTGCSIDRETDSVLIMDTASNKYPPTWVPLELLFTAMRTVDSASGKMRGYIQISR